MMGSASVEACALKWIFQLELYCLATVLRSKCFHFETHNKTELGVLDFYFKNQTHDI